MKTTIKAKIIVFSVSLLLLVIIFQLIFSVFMSKSFFVKEKETEIQELFQSLEKEYSDNPEILDKITGKAQDVYNIKILITDEKRIIYSNINMIGRQMMHEGMKGRFGANSMGNGMMNSHNGWDEKEDILNFTGVIEYNNTPRYITIWSPVESIDASVLMLTRINAGISFIILIIGAIYAYFFAGKLSKPVKQVEKVANDVANLCFDTPANENVSTLELHNLACSVNAMSTKLKEMIDSLYHANQKLRKDIDYQKQAEKMRQEFIANVSHEMKTPLCMLLMYSENLKNNVEGIDKDYYCETIIDEANRLNEMVKSLLEISSIENGLSKVNTEIIDFSDFCKNVISRTEVFTKNFDIEVNIASDIKVEGDKYYLDQAIKNYIMNAVTHTSIGEKIQINLNIVANSAEFSVYNSGSHINEEDIEYIWDSFYRGDKSRKRSDNINVGLGLYIVKTIINAHKGKYGVENVENGVRFWFALQIQN